jgi:hypothetical protein
MDALQSSHTNFVTAQSQPTAAWEPLQIDLLPLPRPNRHFQVWLCSASGIFTLNPLAFGPLLPTAALSGLFLVTGSDPPESLADATAGFNPQSRGMKIQADWSIEAVGTVWAFAVTARAPFVIPTGYTVRAIVVPNPGTAQPGPGAGSVSRLQAQIVDEGNR